MRLEPVYYWEAAVFAEGSFGYFDAGGGLAALVFAAINQGYYHPLSGIHEALERAPFLNGSLFARQDGDDELSLNSTDYWSVDKDEPGLFTILSRYHWTMDEHRPGESEQTLDPELLSNLFERLIASIEEGADLLLRQPQGTYYTPADVTLEMVKDALSAAVRDHAEGFPDNQLLELFGYSDAPPPELAGEVRKHGLHDAGIDGGGGGVVKVDGHVGLASLPPTIHCCDWLGVVEGE